MLQIIIVFLLVIIKVQNYYLCLDPVIQDLGLVIIFEDNENLA